MGTELRRHRGHTGQTEGASSRPRPRGVEAVVQSSAWTGHGAQGSGPPPHRLSASLLSSHRLRWCRRGSSPRAGGSGDRWLMKLQAQQSGESNVAQGGMNPTRDQTRFPSANAEGRSGSKGESSLFQNCMNWRLKICLLDKFTSQNSPQSCFPPLLLARKVWIRNGGSEGW